MVNFKFFHEESKEIKTAKKSLDFKERKSFMASENTSWYLLIYYKDIPIGILCFLENDPETWEVVNIKVKDQLFHRKIGSYLLKFMETKVKDLGGRWVISYIPLSLEKFFLKNGYHESNNGEIIENNGGIQVKIAKFLYPNKFKSRTKY